MLSSRIFREGAGDQWPIRFMGDNNAAVIRGSRLRIISVAIAEPGWSRPPSCLYLLRHREARLAACDLRIKRIRGCKNGVEEHPLRRVVDHWLVQTFDTHSTLSKLCFNRKVVLSFSGKPVCIYYKDSVNVLLSAEREKR